MRKVQFFAGFWTIVIAIPFTVLALVGVAYLTEHLTQIINTLYEFSRKVSVGGRGLILEFSARWPEVAGMVMVDVTHPDLAARILTVLPPESPDESAELKEARNLTVQDEEDGEKQKSARVSAINKIVDKYKDRIFYLGR